MKEKILKDIKSGIYGLCIGDALGLPVQFKTRNYLKNNPVTEMISVGSWDLDAGTWSDDSSLTLCLAESLSRGYDINNIADNFIKWFKFGFLTPDGNAFDIGKTTYEAMGRLEIGCRPEAAGGTDFENNGNGSLMRILPLSFFIARNNIEKEIYYKIVKDVSSITHGHSYSVVACLIYTDTAIEVMNGASLELAYGNVCSQRYIYERLLDDEGIKLFEKFLSCKMKGYSEDEISSTGYVLDSLEAAFWCLLNSASYEETVIKAVNLGNDTDTVAAIAGGLAGIYYGFDSIPESWMNILRKKEIIENVCDQLAFFLEYQERHVT